MSSLLLDTVAHALNEAGWKFHAIEGREVLQAAFDAHHTRVVVHAQAFPQLGAVSIVAELPLQVEEEWRGKTAELLMRINEGLTVGNLELAWQRGLVMFRATNIFLDKDADPRIIVSLVHSAIAECDRLAPSLAIVRGTALPELAGLDLGQLLERDDLLPPIDEES